MPPAAANWAAFRSGIVCRIAMDLGPDSANAQRATMTKATMKQQRVMNRHEKLRLLPASVDILVAQRQKLGNNKDHHNAWRSIHMGSLWGVCLAGHSGIRWSAL